MAIPSGVIIGWPSTAASIPSGWSRVSALDDKFLRRVPNGTTDPGANSPISTHSHTITTHLHTGSLHGHSLTIAQNNSAFARLQSVRDVTLIEGGSHNHTGTIQNASPGVANTSGTSVSDAHNPEWYKVIWIQSDPGSY